MEKLVEQLLKNKTIFKCPKCGNVWASKSQKRYVSCSRCHTHFPRSRLLEQGK